jgi:hypothetical protein
MGFWFLARAWDFSPKLTVHFWLLLSASNGALSQLAKWPSTASFLPPTAEIRICGITFLTPPFPHNFKVFYFSFCPPAPLQPISGLGLLTVEVASSHTIRDAHTSGRTPLNKWSARRRHCYIHNTQETKKRRKWMPSAEFEPTVPATELLHTYALNRTATGIGFTWYLLDCTVANLHISNVHPHNFTTNKLTDTRTSRYEYLTTTDCTPAVIFSSCCQY